MICQKCKEQGLKSRVTGGVGSITCVYYAPYYDEEGVYHSHDGNRASASYQCSNGHRWSQSSYGFCPAPGCDWNNDRQENITWHEDTKEQHVGFFSI